MDIHELALKLGLVDGYIDSIITKALDNPLLLGEPINGNVLESDATTHYLALDWKSEDLSLTTLHLQFYEPIIQGMIQCNMGLLRCIKSISVLLYIQEMLSFKQLKNFCPMIKAFLEADVSSREGFERRIRKQLYSANVNDLIILSQGCSKEDKLVIVAELVEGFFAEVVNDIDLKQDSFISLAEMSIVASGGTKRSSYETYQAIMTYSKPKSIEVNEGDKLLVNLERMSFKVSNLEKELLVIRKEIERAYNSCKKTNMEKGQPIVLAEYRDEYQENSRLQKLQLVCQEEYSIADEDEDFGFVLV
ncbi:phototropic-responsive NPH3 family protein [Tanacetum coccineum]